MSEITSSSLDLIALAIFVVTLAGYGYISSFGFLERRSIVGAVQRQRERWMRNMAIRDVRIVDAQLLGGLSQGNAFFASTSAIIIGATSAMLGSGDKVQSLLERLPFVARASPALFEVKLLVLISIFVFAFFKFAWAFRLSHYAAIMIGATPILDSDNEVACLGHARRTARLIGLAAGHANSGIRSFYYAIAAMAWFFHPVALLVATAWVLAILVRRDFFSRSRRLMLTEG
ncbi:MAG: DUF599 family protein [Hyphomicrobiaceae bacterium]|nr:DUF599 family protein [Hyphomicrobiaceae bacterium]